MLILNTIINNKILVIARKYSNNITVELSVKISHS